MTNGLHWSEIEKLRVKVHALSNMVTALNGDVEDLPEKVAALEAALNRFKGMATVIAILAGAAGALLGKLIP